MAKRKGKSRQREKDWERIRRTGREGADDAESYRRLTQRRVRLPGQGQDEAIFAEVDADAVDQAPQDLLTGTVAQLYPGGAVVRTGEHGDLLCGLAGTFRPNPGSSALAVGDVVTLALTAEARAQLASGTLDPNLNRVDAAILQRAPRQTALSRPQPMSGKRRERWDNEVFEKVIAANMDQLVVVAAVANPPLRPRLLDRYLIIAERGEMPAVLVVNKTDLGTPDERLLATYAALGMASLHVSAATGAGLDAFRERLQGRSSILAGASGVGKSSLLNALVPELDLTTREVRASDRGRHTTSAATLYDLPFGGRVVDTPGVRELGIEIDRNVLPWYFPEIAELAQHCRFRDCTHTHEPHCAVQQAAAEGRLAIPRYDSYLRLFESLEE